MSKLTSKIAFPIILTGLFAITIFIAINYDKLQNSFYVVLFFLAIYVFSFGFAIGQDFTSPIKKLLEKATELSKGNLSSRAYLESKDELAELAAVFNKIADELQESQAQGENTEKSANIKVRAKTQEFQETINALDQKVKNRTIELERLMKRCEELEQQAKVKGGVLASFVQQPKNSKTKTKKGRFKNIKVSSI